MYRSTKEAFIELSSVLEREDFGTFSNHLNDYKGSSSDNDPN